MGKPPKKKIDIDKAIEQKKRVLAVQIEKTYTEIHKSGICPSVLDSLISFIRKDNFFSYEERNALQILGRLIKDNKQMEQIETYLFSKGRSDMFYELKFGAFSEANKKDYIADLSWCNKVRMAFSLGLKYVPEDIKGRFIAMGEAIANNIPIITSFIATYALLHIVGVGEVLDFGIAFGGIIFSGANLLQDLGSLWEVLNGLNACTNKEQIEEKSKKLANVCTSGVIDTFSTFFFKAKLKTYKNTGRVSPILNKTENYWELSGSTKSGSFISITKDNILKNGGQFYKEVKNTPSRIVLRSVGKMDFIGTSAYEGKLFVSNERTPESLKKTINDSKEKASKNQSEQKPKAQIKR